MAQTNTFKSAGLEEMANLLKDNGFHIFYSKWSSNNAKPSYFHFTDGINIGYCQEDLGGLKFSTVHKPCKECGTGFGELGEGKTILESAKKAFLVAPHWANHRDVAAVKKYKNWEEYTSKNNSCQYIQY